MIKTMMRKKILYALLLLPVGGSAQETKADIPRHELTIAVGAFGIDKDYHDDLFGAKPPLEASTAPMNQYHGAKFYYDDTKTLPTLSLGYHYRLSRWLDAGLLAGCAKDRTAIRRHTTDEVTGHFSTIHAVAMPSLRYYAFRFDRIKLYCGLAGGIDLRWKRDLRQNSYKMRPRMAYHITVCGLDVSLTNHLSAIGDLGLGMLGTGRIGLAYHF